MGDDETRTRWTDVFVVVGAGVLGGAHLGKVAPVLPALRAEYELDLVAAGWVVSIFAATAMALGVVAGTGGDRFGHRRLMRVGLGGLALGSAFGGLATGAWALFASRLVEGLGYLAVMVSGPALIAANAFGDDRRLAFGLWAANVPTGIALMTLVAPLMVDALGWRALWHFATAATMGWLAWAVWRRPGAVAGAAEGPAPTLARSLAAIVAVPGPWLIALSFFLNVATWIPVVAWLPSFLIEERAVGPALASVLTALVVLANAPGNVLGGWLMYRGVAASRVVGLAGIVMGVSALGVFSPELPDGWRYALCIVFSGLGGILPAAVFALVPVVAPSQRELGITTGLLIQGANLGVLLGPPAMGWIAVASGAWEGALWPTVAASAAVVAIGWRLGAEERRARPV